MKKLSCLFPLAFLLLSVMAAPAALTDGLVSYWPLDATNAATTPDVSFTNTMSVVGPVTVSAGQVSNAFTFNGSSTYLTNLHATDNSASGLPIYRAGTYTITMWVKGPAQTAKYLYSEASTTSNNPLLILQTGQAAANSNKFDVIIRNDAAGTGGTLVNHVVTAAIVFDNLWHHIAWVDDRGSVKVFVDGNLDSANFSYNPS